MVFRALIADPGRRTRHAANELWYDRVAKLALAFARPCPSRQPARNFEDVAIESHALCSHKLMRTASANRAPRPQLGVAGYLAPAPKPAHAARSRSRRAYGHKVKIWLGCASPNV